MLERVELVRAVAGRARTGRMRQAVVGRAAWVFRIRLDLERRPVLAAEEEAVPRRVAAGEALPGRTAREGAVALDLTVRDDRCLCRIG